MYTSSTRVQTGQSGLDTDTVVKEMMFAKSAKYYKQQRKLQKLQWQQEAYRGAASKISSFQSKWLDITSSTSMRMKKTFNSKYKSTVTDSNGDAVTGGVKITNMTGAASHSVEVTSVAEAAKLQGGSSVSGKIKSDSDAVSFKFNYKGNETTVSFNKNDADLLTDGELDNSKVAKKIASAIGGVAAGDTETTNVNGLVVDVSGASGDDLNVKISSDVAGKAMSLEAGSSTTSYSNKFAVKLDGRTTKFELGTDENGAYNGKLYYGTTSVQLSGTDNASVLAGINEALQDVYGNATRADGSNMVDGSNNPIQLVKATGFDDDGNLVLEAADTETYAIETTTHKVTSDKTGNNYSVKYDSNEENKFDFSMSKTAEGKYALKIGDTTTEYNTAEDAQNALNTQLENKFHKVDNDSITNSEEALSSTNYTHSEIAAVTATVAEDGTVTFKANDEKKFTNSKVVSHSVSSTLTKDTSEVSTSGFDVVKSTSKASNSSELSSVLGEFSGTKTVKINNQDIVIDSDMKISEFVDAVNNSDAGVKMSYNSVSGSFSIETKETGSNQKIEFGSNDDTKEVFSALGFDTSATVVGKDASIMVDGVVTESASNKLVFDDFTVDITNATSGKKYNISTELDTDGAYSMIADFVKEYNELVGGIRSTTKESRATSSTGAFYEPLTDKEKEEMDEKQIEKWETEAKKGILHNDDILNSFLSKMRTTVYSASTTDKNGNKVGIYNFGITTSSDTTKAGQLVLDETKLKNALSEDPDSVINLINSIADSMNDVTKSTTSSSGQLARKAGIEGTSSEFTNSLYTDIKDMKSKMSDELSRLKSQEEKLYEMFAEMEQAISNSNSALDSLFSS